MNTMAVNIRAELYNHAADYARRHNTSIDSLVERYILALMTFMPLEENKDIQRGADELPAGEKWKDCQISEETMRLLPKKRINISDDFKTLLEQRLRSKYESLS